MESDIAFCSSLMWLPGNEGGLEPESATKNHSLLTLNNNNTVGGIRAEAVGGRAAILPAVAGLTVDDLDGDDAVSVSDGVDAVVERLPRLKQKDEI